MSDNPVAHFTSYPLTLYHPVLGAVTVKDQEEAAKTFTPHHNWFRTVHEADAHRTDTEAQMVVHNSRRMQVDDMAAQYDALASGDPDAARKAAAGMHEGAGWEEGKEQEGPVPMRGTVTHSVAFEEFHVKPVRDGLLKTDEQKQEENAAAEKAAQEKHKDDPELLRVQTEPNSQTTISG